MFSHKLNSHLRYISANQARLHMQEQDAALMGHEDLQDSENIYLPASFLGSGCWSSNQIADSLTLAAKYGPPTFFITFTCNGDTGGKGVITQWVHGEFIVSFETICLVNTHQVCVEYF